jgi:hypothetical protein
MMARPMARTAVRRRAGVPAIVDIRPVPWGRLTCPVVKLTKWLLCSAVPLSSPSPGRSPGRTHPRWQLICAQGYAGAQMHKTHLGRPSQLQRWAPNLQKNSHARIVVYLFYCIITYFFKLNRMKPRYLTLEEEYDKDHQTHCIERSR